MSSIEGIEHLSDGQSPSITFPRLASLPPDIRLSPASSDYVGSPAPVYRLPVVPGIAVEPRSGSTGHLYLDTPAKSDLFPFCHVQTPCLVTTLEEFRQDRQELAEYLRNQGQIARSRKVASCGSYLQIAWDGQRFHDVQVSTEDGTEWGQCRGPARVVDGLLCDQYKICPTCAHIMAMRRFAKILPQITCLLHDPRPAYLPVLVTLTVRNGHDLRERLQHLMTSLGKLHKAAKNSQQGQRWSEAARIAGAVWSTEFTRSESGWHPHLHGVCLIPASAVNAWVPDLAIPGGQYPHPFDLQGLRSEWHRITGDSHVVHVRPFDVVSQLVNVSEARRQICQTPELLQRGLLEGLKYATKIEPGNFSDRWSVAEATHGKHLIRRWGVLRKVDPCPVMTRRAAPPLVGEFAWSSRDQRYRLHAVRAFSGQERTWHDE